VDDDPFPIKKLNKLLQIHHLYFGTPNPEDLVPIREVTSELQEILIKTGHLEGNVTGDFDDITRQGLRTLAGMENLEERWDGEGDLIDLTVMRYLRDKFS